MYEKLYEKMYDEKKYQKYSIHDNIYDSKVEKLGNKVDAKEIDKDEPLRCRYERSQYANSPAFKEAHANAAMRVLAELCQQGGDENTHKRLQWADKAGLLDKDLLWLDHHSILNYSELVRKYNNCEMSGDKVDLLQVLAPHVEVQNVLGDLKFPEASHFYDLVPQPEICPPACRNEALWRAYMDNTIMDHTHCKEEFGMNCGV